MRARNIKPSFFKNPELTQVSEATRLLFIGLWLMADRKGRLEDRPAKIKIEIYPCDQHDVNTMLEQLQHHAFIRRYEVDGNRYIQITNFEKHQYPHVREPESTIPAPNKHHTSTKSARLNPEYLNPDVLNPDNTICAEPKKSSVAAPPMIFQGLSLYLEDERLCKRIPAVLPSWYKAYPGVNIRAEICKAHAWEVANPEKRKRNRIKFLNNWLSRAQDKPKPEGVQNGTASSTGISKYAAIARAARETQGLRKVSSPRELLHGIGNLPNVPDQAGPGAGERFGEHEKSDAPLAEHRTPHESGFRNGPSGGTTENVPGRNS